MHRSGLFRRLIAALAVLSTTGVSAQVDSMVIHYPYARELYPYSPYCMLYATGSISTSEQQPLGAVPQKERNHPAPIPDGSLEVFITRLSDVYADSLVDCDGVARDSILHELLAGVNIVVEGTWQGVASDRKGEFHLKSLPLGRTLRFSFVGFATKRIPVRSLSTLPSHVPDNRVPMDSVMENLDSTEVALVRRALEDDFIHIGHSWARDSSGQKRILLLDAHIQKSWLPELPGGGFTLISLEEIEERARQLGNKRDVVYDVLAGIYRTPTLMTIVIKQVVAMYRKRLQKVIFPELTVQTFRYWKINGEWRGGPAVTQLNNIGLPPDE